MLKIRDTIQLLKKNNVHQFSDFLSNFFEINGKGKTSLNVSKKYTKKYDF